MSGDVHSCMRGEAAIRRCTAVAVGVGLALALSACGSDDDTVSTGASSTDTAAATTAARPATDGGEITIADFAFEGPATVAVGTTVVVTNTDTTTHTWTAVAGEFDSGPIGPGESFEFTFAEPGAFDYVCEIHPSMQGSIVVTA